LSSNPQAASYLYGGTIPAVALIPSFSLQTDLQPDILIFPVELEGGILYVIESEFDQDTDINLRDESTGVELKFHLPSQHATLALIDKHTKQIAAKYGLP
jgi:hypothetical protein